MIRLRLPSFDEGIGLEVGRSPCARRFENIRHEHFGALIGKEMQEDLPVGLGRPAQRSAQPESG